MKRLKVYLSKSKAGSMDSLMKVRDLLASYDIELLEFAGGTYSDTLLKSADIILILPPKLPKAFSYNFTLGKGQYTEAYKGLNSGRQEVYFIICPGDELYISQIEHWDVLDKDWQINYAKVWCEETMRAFHKYEPGIVAPKVNLKKYSSKIMLACSLLYK